MRKTARINLAACAEKLGVSVIAASHMLHRERKEKTGGEEGKRRLRDEEEETRLMDGLTRAGKQGLMGHTKK